MKKILFLILLFATAMFSCNYIAPIPSSTSDYISLGEKLVLMNEKQANRYMTIMGLDVRVDNGKTFYIFSNKYTIKRYYLENVVPIVEMNVEGSEDEIKQVFTDNGWIPMEDKSGFTHNNTVTAGIYHPISSTDGKEGCALMFFGFSLPTSKIKQHKN
jgi:hypothetical protein